jgi:hypothetical protein
MWQQILGSSPVPTLLGYAAGGLLDARVIIESGGVPTTFGGWSTLVIGVLIAALGRSAKQTNVSNAPVPVAPATVPPEQLAKPNPMVK